MKKRGLFGLIATFLHDWITPFDPDEDDRKFRYNISQAHRHASPKSVEESQRWEPAELKHLLEPWDFLDKETWEKIYRGELPAEDYMSTVHVSPRPGEIYMGEKTQAFGAYSLDLPDATDKEYPPLEFRTRADPTPMSPETFKLVSDSVPEMDSEQKEDDTNESNSETEQVVAGAEQSNEDSFGTEADNSYDSQSFDQLTIPDDYSSNYGWGDNNEFNVY